MAASAPGVAGHVYDYDAGFDDPSGKNAWFAARLGRSKRVLEMGCATGYVGEYLVRELDCTVVGVELMAESARRARARDVYEAVVEGNLEGGDVDGPLDELGDSYDAVVFGDVLEHLVDPVEVLARVHDRLAPGGHVLICVPNIVHWSIRLRVLAGRFDYTETGTLDRTHLRFFTRRSAAEMVRAAGFDVVAEAGVVWLPGVLARLPAGVHRAVTEWSDRLAPGLFRGQILLDVAPRIDAGR